MKIVINKSHLGGKFMDNDDCPLARAMKIALNRPVAVGEETVSSTYPEDNWKTLGKISPIFRESNYSALVSGEIEEFVTEYTSINN